MQPKTSRRLRRLFLVIPILMLLPLLHIACGGAHLEVRGAPSQPFDALIVPGCPSRADGGLTQCQIRRATWAAILYERGYAHHIVPSGAAVTTPFVEAEAIAAALAVLGVPKDRIYLEPHALHTDENIYNAVKIAQKLGWRRLAVASDPGQARGAGQMLVDYHGDGAAFTMDPAAVKPRMTAAAAQLAMIRAVQRSTIPLAQRERERARQVGRSPRPASFLLYPTLGIRKWLGTPWVPFGAPKDAPIETWADRAM